MKNETICQTAFLRAAIAEIFPPLVEPFDNKLTASQPKAEQHKSISSDTRQKKTTLRQKNGTSANILYCWDVFV